MKHIGFILLMFWMAILTEGFVAAQIVITYNQNYVPEVPEQDCIVSIPVFPNSVPIADAVQDLIDNLMLYLHENITPLPIWSGR